MSSAPVGDDQFGEDPTVNALQSRVATLLGKESALFLPSGTMANQVALRVLTRPGDHVLIAREAHSAWHETGGSAANAGVQLAEIGARGEFTAEEFLAAAHPRGHMIYPPTTLVEIENTHNRAGGVIFPQAEAVRICAAARAHEIASFLDGARLWNVAAATGTPLAELAAPFDLVAVALSKGLGAPGGSLLAGSRALIAQCVRHRRMLGGAMRQTGIYAAAGLFALDNHLARLKDDHSNAQLFAKRLAKSARFRIDLASVQTNIIVFHVAEGGPDAPTVAARAKERGVLVFALGPTMIRAVTHLDVTREQCERAAEVLVELAEA